MDPIVILFGLGVGILVGLTGIGGGSLMTPLLVLFAGVHPVVAIGTDLAYGAVTKTVGGWRLLRRGTVDLGVSSWLAVGSVPGSIAGVVAVDPCTSATATASTPCCSRASRRRWWSSGCRSSGAHCSSRSSSRASATASC